MSLIKFGFIVSSTWGAQTSYLYEGLQYIIWLYVCKSHRGRKPLLQWRPGQNGSIKKCRQNDTNTIKNGVLYHRVYTISAWNIRLLNLNFFCRRFQVAGAGNVNAFMCEWFWFGNKCLAEDIPQYQIQNRLFILDFSDIYYFFTLLCVALMLHCFWESVKL